MKKQQPSASSPTSASPSSAPTYAGECPSGYVHCYKGFEVVDGEVTSVKCEEACGNEFDPNYVALAYPYAPGRWSGGKCCSGGLGGFRGSYTNPCDGFTGSVCRDGSCSGKGACLNSKIDSVVRSCIGPSPDTGPGGTCGSIAQYNNVSVGKIVDSCNGSRSCYDIAQRYGTTKEIVNSCNGINACISAADGGSIESIINACNQERACIYAARGGTVGGGSIIGSITNSCNQEKACESAAARGGSIVEITNSCNGTRACSFAAEGDGGDSISSIGGVGIINSCNADEACYDLARTNSTIVRNCTGTQVAPFCPSYCPNELRRNFTAYYECTVEYCPITLFNRDCYNCTEGAKQVYPYCPQLPLIYYDIDDGLDSCCNSDFECEGIKTEDDLPDDCSVSADLPSKATDILSAKLPEDFSPGPNNKNKDKKNAPFMKDEEGGD